MTAARETPRVLDAQRPQGFFLESERAESGQVVPVATVFLTNRECPWRCLYCDLWKHTTTETVPPGAIPAQIDFALEQLGVPASSRLESPVHHQHAGWKPALPAPQQIKLYNAGSFFDPKAIPPEDFPAIAGRVLQFERVIVECHPALVGESAVRFRDRLLAIDDRRWPIANGQSAPKLEVALGLEIADDVILAKLNKRMTLAMFRRAADFLRTRDIAVRAFVIVKPPFVRTEEQALFFARRSIDFAFDCGAGAVSLIPARFGAAELEALSRSGEFAPPKLETLEAALDYGVGLRRGRAFADLWDLEKFSDCPACFHARRARLERINWQQAIEPSVACPCQHAPGVPPGRTRSAAVTALMSEVPTPRDAGGTS